MPPKLIAVGRCSERIPLQGMSEKPDIEGPPKKESKAQGISTYHWIPAFAGMTWHGDEIYPLDLHIYGVLSSHIMLRLEVENLAKSFGYRKIFENINFTLEPGQSIAVVGPNGSGKTTLLQLILGLSYPTAGKVVYSNDGKKLDFEGYRKYVSLVAPYISLYDSLTANENLRFLAKIGGKLVSPNEIDNALERVGLKGRGDDYVSAYSTGMKQRLKYAVSLLKKPAFWFLDEPSANLDESGKGIISEIINENKDNSIIIIATNEKEEYALADRLCQLGS